VPVRTPQQAGVLAAEPDGVGAVGVDEADELPGRPAR
jgi:hypothetical protein